MTDKSRLKKQYMMQVSNESIEELIKILETTTSQLKIILDNEIKTNEVQIEKTSFEVDNFEDIIVKEILEFVKKKKFKNRSRNSKFITLTSFFIELTLFLLFSFGLYLLSKQKNFWY